MTSLSRSSVVRILAVVIMVIPVLGAVPVVAEPSPAAPPSSPESGSRAVEGSPSLTEGFGASGLGSPDDPVLSVFDNAEFSQDDLPPPPTAVTSRLAGDDRVGTSAAIALEAFPDGAQVVYLARADVNADALAAGGLQDGPVVLTPSCGEVPPVVAETIQALGPDLVIALGGTVAVCDDTLGQAAAGREVGRLAGSSRTGTAVAIAQRAFPDGTDEVLLAGAEDNPDAVAGGALPRGPILLTGQTPDAATLAEVERLAPQRVIALGGTAVVSDDALATIGRGRGTERLAGPGRIQTAVAISGFGFPPHSTEVSSTTSMAGTVYLARADIFVDAVAGGALTGGPVLLVPSCGPLPEEVGARIEELNPSRVTALGGTAAICDDLLALAAARSLLDFYPDVETEIHPDVVVIDTDARQNIAAVSEDRLTVTLAGPSPYLVGNIIIAQPGPDLPDGVVGRVVDVIPSADPGGPTQLTLAPVTITDIVISGTLVFEEETEVSTPFGEQFAAGAQQLYNDHAAIVGEPAARSSFACCGIVGFFEDLASDGETAVRGLKNVAQDVLDGASGLLAAIGKGVDDAVRAVGQFISELTTGTLGDTYRYSAVIDPVVITPANAPVEVKLSGGVHGTGSMSLQIRNALPVAFAVTNTTTVGYTAHFTASAGITAEFEKELARLNGATYVGFVGPVPIWVTPNVALTAFASAEAGVGGSAVISASRTVGGMARWNPRDGWTTRSTGRVGSFNSDIDDQLQFEASAEAGLEAALRLSFFNTPFDPNGIAPGVAGRVSILTRLTPQACPILDLALKLRAFATFEALSYIKGVPRLESTFAEYEYGLFQTPRECAQDRAVVDSFTVEGGRVTTLDVLANDIDEADRNDLLISNVRVPGGSPVRVLASADRRSVVFDTTGEACNKFHYLDYRLDSGSWGTVRVFVTCSPAPQSAGVLPDVASLVEDDSVRYIPVLDNDTPPIPGPLRIGSVTQPAGGTTASDGTGVTYRPNPDFCTAEGETDDFTYTLQTLETAVVRVTVACVDDLGVPTDDAFSVAEDAAAVDLDVRVNDPNPDGGRQGSLRLIGLDMVPGDTLAFKTTHGRVDYDGGGLTYRPDRDVCGVVDSFDYGYAGVAQTATVRVSITCVDDPPRAVEDFVRLAQGAQPRTIPVLGNDDDADGGLIAIASVTQPANGTVVITDGGSALSYQPPSATFCTGSGAERFTYTLSPGGSSTSVSVRVTCPDNDNPVANDDTLVVSEDDPATFVGVLRNDTPDRFGDTSVVGSFTQPAGGEVIGDGQGDLRYTPDPDFCTASGSTDDFTYTLARGGSTATVRVTVNCSDDPPTAFDDRATVDDVAGPTPIDVLANDRDPDGEPVGTIASVTQPAHGTVAITDGGADLTYDPDGNFCTQPPEDELDTFTYTLTTGGSTATVRVNVVCTT